jgi:hypothetical protein
MTIGKIPIDFCCDHEASRECKLGTDCAGNDSCPPYGLEMRNRIQCQICGEIICSGCGTSEWWQCN